MKKILYYIVFTLWYIISLLPLRVLYVLSDILYLVLYRIVGGKYQTVDHERGRNEAPTGIQKC